MNKRTGAVAYSPRSIYAAFGRTQAALPRACISTVSLQPPLQPSPLRHLDTNLPPIDSEMTSGENKLPPKQRCVGNHITVSISISPVAAGVNASELARQARTNRPVNSTTLYDQVRFVPQKTKLDYHRQKDHAQKRKAQREASRSQIGDGGRATGGAEGTDTVSSIPMWPSPYS